MNHTKDDERYCLEHTDIYLVKIHDPKLCEGRACPVHNLSDHHMRDFPQHWRQDRGLMERICPHGVGHPDPDHLAYRPQDSIHGCDGCCESEHREHCMVSITPTGTTCTCERRTGERRIAPQTDDWTMWRRFNPPYAGTLRRAGTTDRRKDDG